MSEDGPAASSAAAQSRAPPQCTESAASRAARWTRGQLVFYVPGLNDARSRAMSDEARESLFAGGRPVLLVDPRPSAAGTVRADDGHEELVVEVLDLVEVGPEEVGSLGRVFAHAAASPSPRCAALLRAPTPRRSPLAWLSPAGLQAAGHATFEVAARALRHLIGRGGATIRRLEAGLGVLVGVVDSPAGSAAVSLCGPPGRLTTAEAVIHLVSQGHRSLLQRLEEDPGTWAGSDAVDE